MLFPIPRKKTRAHYILHLETGLEAWENHRIKRRKQRFHLVLASRSVKLEDDPQRSEDVSAMREPKFVWRNCRKSIENQKARILRGYQDLMAIKGSKQQEQNGKDSPKQYVPKRGASGAAISRRPDDVPELKALGVFTAWIASSSTRQRRMEWKVQKAWRSGRTHAGQDKRLDEAGGASRDLQILAFKSPTDPGTTGSMLIASFPRVLCRCLGLMLRLSLCWSGDATWP